jgi:hypothetical protein
VPDSFAHPYEVDAPRRRGIGVFLVAQKDPHEVGSELSKESVEFLICNRLCRSIVHSRNGMAPLLQDCLLGPQIGFDLNLAATTDGLL